MKNTDYHQLREAVRNRNYEKDSPPSRVVMVITNNCNLDCYFCFQDR